MVLRFEQRLQELGLIWGWTVHHQKVSDELSLSDKIKMLEPFALRYPNKYIILETASDGAYIWKMDIVVQTYLANLVIYPKHGGYRISAYIFLQILRKMNLVR